MIENNKSKNYKDLNVIYEDNQIIVVQKFVNIPSQADKTNDTDMLSLVKEYIKVKYKKQGNVYLGLVHRLDRPVGGLMVFARTSKAASRLSEIIRCNKFNKEYLAIVNGYIKKDEDTLEDYLIKDKKNNISKVTKNKNQSEVKQAILRYKVIKKLEIDKRKLTILKIELKTGRHHQIRVQLSNIGHALYGDQKYGMNINKIGEQLALFAYKLEFKHPVRDEIMKFKLVPNLGIWKEINIDDYIR